MRAQQRPKRRLFCAGLLAGATGLAGFAVGVPAAAQETGEIRGTNDVQAIENSYIVTLEESEVSAQAVGSTARALAAEYGGQVQHTYDSVLRGFSVRMTEQQARRLATESHVAYVEQDSMAHVVGTQNNPTWGLDRIDQSELPLDSTYTYPDSAGSGVTAYIIDTGLRTTHNEFGDRASSGHDFIDDDPRANDCNGHGTHVAGTIGGKTYGVAKQAELVGVRVLNCEGRGAWSDVIAGIDWTAENAQGPAVANMSIGGSPSSSVDDAVRGLIQAGVTVAIAAGNAGEDACNTSPARVTEAITVGASNKQDERSTWPRIPGAASNWGRCLDIFAPGTAITSAWNSSDTATHTINGTSMASPHVAGAAALHLAAHPNAAPQQVRDALVSNATSGALTGIRSGSPNKLLNTSYLVGDQPDEPEEPPAGEAPKASFTTQCGLGSGCTFDAGGSTDDGDIASYAWDFGDGRTGSGETTRHTYTAGGNYTVTLTVTDGNGRTGSAQQQLSCYDFGSSAYCFTN